MGWSVKLFSVRNIPVRVHFTFLLIIVYAAYRGLVQSQGRDLALNLVFMEAFVLLLFACVVLHELAHALAAQLFGVQVQDITLWPLGGLARMARLPENPLSEFVITAAGPAMNIFLAIIGGAALVLWLGVASAEGALSLPEMFGSLLGTLDGRSLLATLVLNNVALALFNLVPAFPMDGGRLLRALLAAFLPFATATRVASWVGQGMAVIMLAVALIQPGLLVLGLVALLVFLVAGQERQEATIQADLRGLCVRQAMQPIGRRLHPLETFGQVADAMRQSPQPFYLVVDAGRLLGLLSRGDALDSLRRLGPDARIAQQFNRDLLVLKPDDTLVSARERLVQRKSAFAVVADRGSVLGLLTPGDIVRFVDLLKAYPALRERS